jgi:proline iminopeptidase
MPGPQPAAGPYPQIEPDHHGLLGVGDGNLVYWETCGNPDGKAALVLHGGPGSGCTPGLRRYFDPAVYRIVLFDQRGCGRSRPHASDPAVSLAAAVRREVEWITRDMQRHFPAEWARFAAGVPAAERDGSLAAAYSRLLNHRDEAVRVRAASDWCAWEDTHVSVDPRDRHNPRYDDPAFRMVFARMVTHYWSNDCFLEEGALLRDAGALAGIPGVLAHGRLDVSSPIDVPWQLAQVWPDSELVIIGDAAHTGSATMTGVILAATDRFAADG